MAIKIKKPTKKQLDENAKKMKAAMEKLLNFKLGNLNHIDTSHNQ